MSAAAKKVGLRHVPVGSSNKKSTLLCRVNATADPLEPTTAWGQSRHKPRGRTKVRFRGGRDVEGHVAPEDDEANDRDHTGAHRWREPRMSSQSPLGVRANRMTTLSQCAQRNIAPIGPP